MPEQTATVDDVRAYWDAHPCGADFVDAEFGTPEFFRRYDVFRYEKEWHLDELVPFEAWRGKDVLEIGCGLGADGARIAAAGASYTGVDLTPAAVGATEARFRAFGLPGRFLVQNAEELPLLEDESFDVVYSHGVLHHTADMPRALRQVHRVLRPGGQFLFMWYHKRSINYYLRILGYMRAAVALYAVARRLGRAPGALEPHYRNLRRMGLRYLSSSEFPHHATDGADCQIARILTMREARALLEPVFRVREMRVAHLPIRAAWRGFPRAVERTLAAHFGFYLFIYGDKPAAAGG